MNLENLEGNALHAEAVRAAKIHATAESYLLDVLSVVEKKKFYLDCGLTSLYQYCVQLLNLSEAISYSLIAVIHKSKDVPELKSAVQSGEVTLSKAKKICSVVTYANHKEWIDLAKHETSRVIEKCVAQANPKEAVKESIQYRNAERLEFKLGISEEWLETLTKVKDLLAQKNNKAISSEDALLEVMQEFITRNDPVEKAERAQLRLQKKAECLELKAQKKIGTCNKATDAKAEPQVPQLLRTVTNFNEKLQFPGTVAQFISKRKPIKRMTFHQVTLRDRHQCTVITEKGRCQQKRWLDIHHKISVAEGGSNEIDNLTTLCRTHHRRIHESDKFEQTH